MEHSYGTSKVSKVRRLGTVVADHPVKEGERLLVRRRIPQASRVLALFLLSAAILALAYCALIRIADPYGLFGTGWFPVLANDVRGDKLGLFRTFASENSVQGIVLGTSRSMKIDPRILGDTSGARFFNFSVGNARAEDYLAIYRWVRAQRIALRMVILGLDVEAFHDDDILDTTLEFNRELRTALGDRPTSSVRAFVERVRLYKRSMGIAAVKDAVRTIAVVRFAEESRAPQRIWPDGRLEQFERKPTLLGVCNDGMQRRYAKMTKLSPRRLARLDMLISEAIADGASVKLWLTPLDPMTRDHLNERTLYRQLSAALRAHLANLAKSVPIELFDYEDPRAFKGDPAVWDDCSHVNEADAARIAVRLIGSRG